MYISIKTSYLHVYTFVFVYFSGAFQNNEHGDFSSYVRLSCTVQDDKNL